MNRLTAKEIQYFPVRTLKSKPLVSDRQLLMALVLGVLLLVGLAVNTFALTPGFIGAETAHASEVQEIHQNDYYCERIKSGFYPNIGTGKGITELCAKWGVDL